jgi:hypothetical protein
MIYKLDMLFSALIPNFFFKDTRSPEQFSEISLGKKKKTSNLEVRSFENRFSLNNNMLLLALHLQKTSNLIITLDYTSIPKFTFNQNLVTNLNLIPKYSTNLISTIFLSTKLDYNNFHKYRFSLVTIDEKYLLRSDEVGCQNTYTSTLDLLSLFRSNFKLQKFISNNVTKNLNLAKQNR